MRNLLATRNMMNATLQTVKQVFLVLVLYLMVTAVFYLAPVAVTYYKSLSGAALSLLCSFSLLCMTLLNAYRMSKKRNDYIDIETICLPMNSLKLR